LEIKLTKAQSEIFSAKERFKVVVAGRRFGKSFLAATQLYSWASQTPEGIFYFVAPTYGAAKQILWRMLKSMFGAYATKTNESELFMEFPNRSVIYLKGAENQDALRGVSLSGVVLDEAAFMEADVWHYVISPATSDREAPVLFITSPAGWNWIKELFDYAQKGDDPDWRAFSYTTADGGNVSQQEIERSRRTLPPKVFEQEYLACHHKDTMISTTKGDKKIKDIKVGDTVFHIGADGDPMETTVLQTGKTKNKQVYEALLETGEVVKSSPDHNFRV
jgi:hypothetical protein